MNWVARKKYILAGYSDENQLSTGGGYSLNNGSSYIKTGGNGSRATNQSVFISGTGGLYVSLNDINLNNNYGYGGGYGGTRGSSSSPTTGYGANANTNSIAAPINTSVAVYGGSGIVIIYFPTYIG